MAINGVTSTLPDPGYIQALERKIVELERTITNIQASIRSTQNR